MYETDYNEKGKRNDKDLNDRMKNSGRKSQDRNQRIENLLSKNENHTAATGHEEDLKKVEQQREIRRRRKEKKIASREAKQEPEEVHDDESQQSPSTDYPFETPTETHNLRENVNFDDPSLDKDLPASQSQQDAKHKKKGAPFGKVFAPFKRKSKGAKQEDHSGEPSQSATDLDDPDGEAQPEVHLKPMRKIPGKSARDLTMRKAHIILLDAEEVEIELDLKATGRLLFDKVCQDLELLEKDFFGLTYIHEKLQTSFWLELDKKISKQRGKKMDWIFNFQVKFYPPEPVLLKEDLTRYLISLQVRQDVFTGKLPCSWITQAILGSLMVQSDLGDFEEIQPRPSGIDYLRQFEFVLNQSEQLLEKIGELHKKHRGMSPDKADMQYLEAAKGLEQYGVDLHRARDNEDVEIFVGVCYQGVIIYRDRHRIGRFAWPKVLRISYKKNYFYLKIRSGGPDDLVTVVGFRLQSYHLAKRLWKNAAEQHTFYRLKEPPPPADSTSFGKGSITSTTFNFRGRTLHQYRTLSISRSRPSSIERAPTRRRTQSSMPTGLDHDGSPYSSERPMGLLGQQDMDHQGSLGSLEGHPLPPYPGRGFVEEDGHFWSRSGDSLDFGRPFGVTEDDKAVRYHIQASPLRVEIPPLRRPPSESSSVRSDDIDHLGPSLVPVAGNGGHRRGRESSSSDVT